MTPAELRAWRTDRGLTLDALAAALGIERTTLWRYESGKTPITAMLTLALEALDARRNQAA